MTDLEFDEKIEFLGGYIWFSVCLLSEILFELVYVVRLFSVFFYKCGLKVFCVV